MNYRNEKSVYKLLVLFIVLAAIIGGGFFFITESIRNTNDKEEQKFEQAKTEYYNSANPIAENKYQLEAAIHLPIAAMSTASASYPITLAPIKNIKLSKGKLLVPIVMYHYIEPMPAETTLKNLYLDPTIFEDQIRILSRAGYTFVTVRQIGRALRVKAPLPQHPLALTFDDGYEDFYTLAFPILKKYNAKATIYIIVDFLGQPGYLTRSQVRELSKSGLVEIAAHTLSHADLSKADNRTAWKEIYQSKIMLEKIIGGAVDDFAYPFGFYTGRDEFLVSQAGYLTAASTHPGEIQSLSVIYELYRIRALHFTGLQLFRLLNSD